MSNEQLLELFVHTVLSKRDRQFVSHPLNTRHNEMFEAFKKGLELGVDAK